MTEINTPNRRFGYARVSTVGQTLDSQLEQLLAAGCTAKIYREKVKGAHNDRRELLKMLKALAPGDVVTVRRLDRLARSTFDQFAIVKQIVDAKAQFRSLAEPWADTGTSTGRLMIPVLGGLPDMERDLIRTRTAEGRSRAQKRGQRMGRKPKLTEAQQAEARKKELGIVLERSREIETTNAPKEYSFQNHCLCGLHGLAGGVPETQDVESRRCHDEGRAYHPGCEGLRRALDHEHRPTSLSPIYLAHGEAGPMLDDYAVRVREGAVWVIEQADAIFGLIVLLPASDYLLLDNIAVAPERQGLGIGRRLLNFAETEALRRGYREIHLYTHETMIENQRLYSALGYEETGRAAQDGYDRVFMCKQLGGTHEKLAPR